MFRDRPARGRKRVTVLVHQASCVAIDDRAILIEGAPGTGKSSLALALIDRGAILIGDDGVTLTERDGALWAGPPPNISGLIEIRNVGLATVPTTEAAVALVIQLDEDAPRYVEQAEERRIGDAALPLIRLWPHSSALHLRAEWALRLHGKA